MGMSGDFVFLWRSTPIRIEGNLATFVRFVACAVCDGYIHLETGMDKHCYWVAQKGNGFAQESFETHPPKLSSKHHQ